MTLREKLDYAMAGTRSKIGLSAAKSQKVNKGRIRRAFARGFPQWLRTVLVMFVEMAMAMNWLAATSTASQMGGAISIALLHPVAVGIAVHVWPTRTPPWRTLVWTWLLSWLTASILYMGWGVDWTIYPAIAIIVIVTAARCNANLRRAVNWLIAKNVERTFGHGATLETESTPRPSASERAERIAAAGTGARKKKKLTTSAR